MDSPQQQQQDQQPSLKHLFIFTTWKHRAPLAGGLIASLLSAALRTSLAILTGKVFAVITAFGSGQLNGLETVSQVSSWCGILTGVGAAGWIVNCGFMSAWIIFGEIHGKFVRRRLFKALLKKDMEWFDRQEHGVPSLLVRLQTQAQELQSASSLVLGYLITQVATPVASLGLALCSSWKLTLVIIATSPVSAGIVIFMNDKLKPRIQAQKQELSNASKYAISAVKAIDLVKVFDTVDHEISQYSQAIRRSTDKYLIQARITAFQGSYVRLWLDGMFVLGFYYGAVLVDEGLSPGTVMTTFYATLSALQAIQDLLPLYPALVRGMSAGQALYSITNDVERGREVRRLIGSQRPRVSFAYPSNPSKVVLSSSSFSFEAGRLYFIVGRSGSGKSTIGNLILKFYEPLGGSILIDGHAIETLDVEWVRSNVTLIQQTSVLFNNTFFMNVAMGLKDPNRASRAEVKAACEMALLQTTLATLPDGLDTHIGPDGHDLSGGQKQRLALARAKLRDTPVLILDEVTSGLDPASCSLIIDAVRQWRRDKTTIIITHEVAQIKDYDFVYVVDNASVVQRGFRRDLRQHKDGAFATLIASSDANDSADHDAFGPKQEHDPAINFSRPRSNASQVGRLVSRYFWPFSMYDCLSQRTTLAVGPFPMPTQPFLNQKYWDGEGDDNRSPQTGELMGLNMLSRTVESLGRRLSASRAERHRKLSSGSSRQTTSSGRASIQRLQELGNKVRDDRADLKERRTIPSNPKPYSKNDNDEILDGAKRKTRPVASLWEVYKTVPPSLTPKERTFLAIGFLACIGVGGSVPAFSYVFANLLAVLSSTENRIAAGQKWSLYLLAISLGAATLVFVSQYLTQRASQIWIDALRKRALKRVLQQPKSWFDQPKHSASRIGECMDRDAEEMRNIVGRFAPMLLIVVIMISGTLTWALFISWRLTVVSLGGTPALLGISKVYAHVAEKWEARCDEAAEEVNAVVTESLINVSTVRAFRLESFFSDKQEFCTQKAFQLGLRKSVRVGILFATWQSISWFIIALIFWYATKLIAEYREATVPNILQVVNLLVLGLTNASLFLNSIPGMTAAQAAAARLLYYANLPINASHKSKSKIAYPFPIRMDSLSFTYPSTTLPVLRDLTLYVDAGTSTAIVGSSGCGKSTIASIILGLYVPDSSPGEIEGQGRQLTFASIPASEISAVSLRSHMGYVPQAPFLFPNSLAANISYGLPEDSPLRDLRNIERAATEAGIHDFIHSLPDGYDTAVGDGGQTLSGGQTQKVCIARALARRPQILVLDEPTSALDAESAEAVRDTIETLMWSTRIGAPSSSHRGAQEGLSIIVVTHSKEMMRTVDRIVMIDEGRVAESGTYNELLAKRGKFAQLVGGGLWKGGNGSGLQKRQDTRHGSTATNDLPLRNSDETNERYSVTTPRWVGLRDVSWPDDRGPSTGLMSPLASPFPGPSRRKERKG
ncbi:P-loop containing nucleoside triphosphate hydrolase protein [Hypoxylon sp. NC1633]|nr:P-loop containing nucleoside triphosphate hydrolase protein [Hypoxylon sp. NC1633]